MKNTFKLFGIIAAIAIIGFSMLACDTGGGGNNTVITTTSGSLTISGMGSYNGRYVLAMSMGLSGEEESPNLIAAVDISSSSTITGGQISNGSATIKVWSAIDENNIGNYNGSDTVGFMILVTNKAVI